MYFRFEETLIKIHNLFGVRVLCPTETISICLYSWISWSASFWNGWRQPYCNISDAASDRLSSARCFHKQRLNFGVVNLAIRFSSRIYFILLPISTSPHKAMSLSLPHHWLPQVSFASPSPGRQPWYVIETHILGRRKPWVATPVHLPKWDLKSSHAFPSRKSISRRDKKQRTNYIGLLVLAARNIPYHFSPKCVKQFISNSHIHQHDSYQSSNPTSIPKAG